MQRSHIRHPTLRLGEHKASFGCVNAHSFPFSFFLIGQQTATSSEVAVLLFAVAARCVAYRVYGTTLSH
jgi:hypothetical protein